MKDVRVQMYCILSFCFSLLLLISCAEAPKPRKRYTTQEKNQTNKSPSSQEVKSEQTQEKTASKSDAALAKEASPTKETIPKHEVAPPRPPQGTSFGGQGIDEGRSLQVNAKAEVFFAGSFQDSIQINGTTYRSQGKSDIFLAKKDKHGKILWFSTFGSTSYDAATDLVLDSKGNIYLTGYFSNQVVFGKNTRYSNGRYDCFLLKLDPHGEVIWSKTFGSSNYDRAFALAIDNRNQVLMTGYFHKSIDFGDTTLQSKGSYGVFVASISPQGEVTWAKSISGEGKQLKQGLGIVVDQQRRVYVIGSFSTSLEVAGIKYPSKGKKDVFLAQFSNQGTLGWLQTFGGPEDDEGLSLDITPQGKLLFLAQVQQNMTWQQQTWSTPKKSVLLAKLTPQGKLRWHRLLETKGPSITARSLSSDRNEGALITGSFTGSLELDNWLLTSQGKKDIFAIHINQDGKVNWSESFGSYQDDEGTDITVSPTGIPYLLATIQGDFNLRDKSIKHTGKSDILVLSLHHRKAAVAPQTNIPEKNNEEKEVRPEVFLEKIPADTSDGSVPPEVPSHEEEQDSLHHDTPPATSSNIITLSKSKDRWLQYLRFYPGNKDLHLEKMIAGEPGYVYMTGRFSGTWKLGKYQVTSKGKHDIFVAKMDTSGNVVWIKSFGTQDEDYGQSIFYSKTGHVLVSGSWKRERMSKHFFTLKKGSSIVLKLDIHGKIVWEKRAESKSIEHTTITGDSQGNIFLAGQSTVVNSLPQRYGDINIGSWQKNIADGSFIIKMNAKGEPLWLFSAKETTTTQQSTWNSVQKMALDSQGNLIFAGNFRMEIQFAGKVYKGSRSSSQHAYIAKLNPQGRLLWLKTIGSTTSQRIIRYIGALAVDKHDHIALTGKNNSSLHFDNRVITEGGKLYVLKLNKEGSFSWVKTLYAGNVDYSMGLSLAFDQQANAYVTGFTMGPAATNKHPVQQLRQTTHDDTMPNHRFLWKLSPTGEEIYFKNSFFESTEERDDIEMSLVLTPTGKVLLAGNMNGDWSIKKGILNTTTQQSIFLLQYNDSNSWGSCQQDDDCSMNAHCNSGRCEKNSNQCKLQHAYCTSSSIRSGACVRVNGSFVSLPQQSCTTTQQCTFGSCRKKCTTTSDCPTHHTCSENICVRQLLSFTPFRTKPTIVLQSSYFKTLGSHVNVYASNTGKDAFYLGGQFTQGLHMGKHNLRFQSNYYQAFAAQLDKQGNTQWLHRFPGDRGSKVIGLKPDGKGNVYIRIQYYESIIVGSQRWNATDKRTPAYILVKFNRLGKLLWSKNNLGEKVLSFDSQGNFFHGAEKYSSNGTSQGSFQISHYVHKTLVDQKGNLFAILNNSKLSAAAPTIVLTVSKYNKTKKQEWLLQFNGKKRIDITASTLDKHGNLYLTGRFQGELKLDSKVIATSQNKYGNMFLLKLTLDGKLGWFHQSNSSGGKVFLQHQQQLSVLLSFSSPVTFGRFQLKPESPSGNLPQETRSALISFSTDGTFTKASVLPRELGSQLRLNLGRIRSHWYVSASWSEPEKGLILFFQSGEMIKVPLK